MLDKEKGGREVFAKCLWCYRWIQVQSFCTFTVVMVRPGTATHLHRKFIFLFFFWPWCLSVERVHQRMQYRNCGYNLHSKESLRGKIFLDSLCFHCLVWEIMMCPAIVTAFWTWCWLVLPHDATKILISSDGISFYLL